MMLWHKARLRAGESAEVCRPTGVWGEQAHQPLGACGESPGTCGGLEEPSAARATCLGSFVLRGQLAGRFGGWDHRQRQWVVGESVWMERRSLGRFRSCRHENGIAWHSVPPIRLSFLGAMGAEC